MQWPRRHCPARLQLGEPASVLTHGIVRIPQRGAGYLAIEFAQRRSPGEPAAGSTRHFPIHEQAELSPAPS